MQYTNDTELAKEWR